MASGKQLPKLKSIIDQSEEDWQKFVREQGIADELERKRKGQGMLEQRGFMAKLNHQRANPAAGRDPHGERKRGENQSAAAMDVTSGGLRDPVAASAGQMRKFVV